jgi:transposase-like protein
LGRRSKYSPEFQAAAVRLLAEPGATNDSVGRDLGLSRETIRLWAKRLAGEGAGHRGLFPEPRVPQARRRRTRTMRG